MGYNIGIINEDLLQSIYRDLLDEAQLQALSEVSTLGQFSQPKPY